MAYKYGIDFGTTNSSIAICFIGDDEEKHTLVVDRERPHPPFTLLPSLFYIDENEILVGDEAEYKYCNMKGDDNRGIFVKKIKLFLEKKGQNLNYKVGDKVYDGCDIIAELFRRLREDAEKHIAYLDNVQMDGVVIGVPVAFDQIAKNILTEALYKAGFYQSLEEASRKTEFVSEPIAVAIHYGLDLKKDMTVMIYDHGGGTLDLAIVNLKENIEDDVLHPHETISKDRRNYGGEELTRMFFVNCFCKDKKYGRANLCRKFGLPTDLSENELWMKLVEMPEGIKLIQSIEECKCELSKKIESKFSFVGTKVVLDVKTFYREEFEESIQEVLDSIDEMIDDCLEAGDIDDPYDIDKVIIAGGSSLIPAIQEIITSKFGYNKLAVKGVDDDKFVKEVARIKGAESQVLTSIVRGLARVGFERTQLVEDVVDCSFGLWDGIRNNYIEIIPAGIPVKDTEFSKLTQEGLNKEVECPMSTATAVDVPVYQRKYDGDHKLGTICIRHPGSMQYRIYMTIHPESGMLEVILYDIKQKRWIDDIPLNERRYEI